MKLKIKTFIVLVTIFFVGCITNKIDKPLTKSSCIKITIPEQIDNILQSDSIFLKMNAIPLETTDKCLIGQISKVLFFKEKMFILDNLNKLFAFDTIGKFLYTVGKEGRGPGEYLELRDFDIDNLGNIYILSYGKILKYSLDGKFLKTFSFKFEDTGIHCNPLEFAIKNDGKLYIWGGSVGIKDNSDGKLFAMYEISDNGKIINKYFPLKYPTTQSFEKHRFSRFKNEFRIEPNFGVNIINSPSDEGLQPIYEIDFGKKNNKFPIPEGFKSSAEFKLKVDQLSCHSIEAFIETDEWIYFRFLHKMKRYNVYYSKNLKRSFVSRFKNDIRLTIPMLISSKLENRLISFCDPQLLISYIKENAQNGGSLSAINANLIDVKPTDNPILLVCLMRKY
jgi:hypothetical protein